MTDTADARAAFERALDELLDINTRISELGHMVPLVEIERYEAARAEVLRLWDAQRAAPGEGESARIDRRFINDVRIALNALTRARATLPIADGFRVIQSTVSSVAAAPTPGEEP